MKKNWTLKTGGILLALTLITSCFVGGTFAKYVTSGEGKDTARVAKFGVTVTATGNAFAREYATTDTTATTVTKSVASSDSDNVVAPGTSGQMGAVTVAGKPEVAVRVSQKAEFELGDNWKLADDSYYCPLVITVGAEQIKGVDYESADAFETAVESKIADYTEDYDAGTDLSKKSDDFLSVSWEWPFSGAADNDVKDTYLGGQAANGTEAMVSLTVTTTVTQMD